jgi:beta-lysine 5,6-aminomutase alpha subunit
MSDRYLAIENANYINRTMKDLGDEIVFKKDGIIETRANKVVDDATNLLKEIANIGIFETLERGIFAGIKRTKIGGKGLKGVSLKDPKYTNPILDQMVKAIKEAK